MLATLQPFPGPLLSAVGHPLLVTAALLWARRVARFSWAEIGLSRTGWDRSAFLGLGSGLLMGVVAGALFLAGLIVLGVAGLLFGWLRHTTRHLAGPVVAHAVIDVTLALTLMNW